MRLVLQPGHVVTQYVDILEEKRKGTENIFSLIGSHLCIPLKGNNYFL